MIVTVDCGNIGENMGGRRQGVNFYPQLPLQLLIYFDAPNLGCELKIMEDNKAQA